MGTCCHVVEHQRQQRTHAEQWQAAQAYAGAQKGWEYAQRARAAAWSIGSNGSTMSGHAKGMGVCATRTCCSVVDPQQWLDDERRAVVSKRKAT